jgi:SAM-dependent methyltransferase
MKNFTEELLKIVPQDHVDQFNSRKMIDILLKKIRNDKIEKVLDLGCGDGRAYDWLVERIPNLNYLGIDINDSPEVSSRTRTGCLMQSYDGQNIPQSDSTFDLCFTNQVFEHVRYPEKVLLEINRVLRPGGFFVGSLSYLEPYHSYSIYNFTPYGWYSLCLDNGFVVINLAGGVDGLSMINRSLDKKSFDKSWWAMSPENNNILCNSELTIAEKNKKILLHSAYICFICQKPF